MKSEKEVEKQLEYYKNHNLNNLPRQLRGIAIRIDEVIIKTLEWVLEKK